ncbi:SLBB domain-containing protein [Sphingomonas sp.]|uniref:polysaccharide biosynthesis/export family protein n=1 Tax=Sphingomonas sp. TaxID=28214 RepID=UPI003CC55F2D
MSRLALACASVSLGWAATPAAAQIADTAYGSGQDDPYATRSTGAAAADSRAMPATQQSRDAAATQVEARSDRYQPDEIRASDQTRATDGTASRRGADAADAERLTDRDRADLARLRRSRTPPPPSEFEAFVSRIVDRPLRRFGANLLVPDALDFTAPPETVAVPEDYRFNPGDELRIGLTGSIQASDLRLTVDSEGRIFIPRVGAVSVGGVRYGDVQARIAAAVTRVYHGFRVSITVGRLHGITVYVTGFAAQPGSYTVSGLATVVNAVLAAGGPSAGGSFRSIQVRRGGRLVSDFDLYDLLLKGDRSADALLQNGDVIFVAPAGAQVAVVGSVNNEAIFEARAHETLNDVLLYAGGVSTVADDSRLLVLDALGTTGTGYQQLTPAEVRTRPALRGQVIRVLSGIDIARPLQQQPVLVTLSGEVAHPGRYYVPAGTTLATVVAQAGGLTAEAYPFGAVFTRDSLRTQQQMSYDRAVRDVDLLLTAQPLTTASSSTNQLSAERLQQVRAVVEQLRSRRPEGRLILEAQPDATALPDVVVLENNDAIYVPPYNVSVGVFGSVPSPASFQYRPGTRVADYLARAGGVQKIGDRKQIFVVRANGTVLSRSSRGNFLSQPALPGDLVFVPIDSNRGEFWARLRDITSVLFNGALAAATVKSVTN